MRFNIFSGSTDGNGLAAALTNPTSLSRRKGTTQRDYPVYFDGVEWPDAETAFLNRQQHWQVYGPSGVDSLMVDIIVAKLEQHPQLAYAVKRRGGVAFLAQCEHFTGATSDRFRAWEGHGRESRFIRNLIAAYERWQAALRSEPLQSFEPHQTTVDGKRHYTTPLGKLPSVTAILRATKDTSGLRAWQNKVGAVEAARVSTAAAARGTSLHAEVEQYFKTGTVGDSDHFASLVPFLETVTSVALVEGAVWHPSGYAGAVDFVGRVCGSPTTGDVFNEPIDQRARLCVVDWKTAEKPKREDWIDDYFAQVAAYVDAVEFVYGVSVEDAAVVIALPDVEAQVFWLGAALAQWQETFQTRLSTYKGQ